MNIGFGNEEEQPRWGLQPSRKKPGIRKLALGFGMAALYGCMGHHDRQDRDARVSFTLTSDDDTRPRDVTEASNAQGMMSPSAFSLIRPTIATYVAIPSFYSGGWLASWRLVRHHRGWQVGDLFVITANPPE